MDWLAPVFTALINKLDPVSIVLILMLAICNYASFQSRKEDRQDKKELIDVVKNNTAALNKITTVVSVALHKVIE